MKEQLATPLIGIIVTALLSLWKIGSIRDGVFAWVGKLPRQAQWVPPLLIAMAGTAGEGFLSGKTGEDLFYFAAGNGAEAGALAIAFWHIVKRFRSEVKVAGPAGLLIVASLGLASHGCSLEAARQARVNSALKASASGAPVAARPVSECKALDDVHVYTMYGAEISLGVGTAAGVLAAADTSSTVENAAIGTGIGAAAVAAGLAYWSQKSGAIWTETCSQ